jgi:hypothetical protein
MNGRPDDPQDRFTFYRVLLRTGHNANKIALDWGLKNAEALFHLLRQDGFPVCETCGAHSKLGPCEKCRFENGRKSQRGSAEVLPSAENASDLFVYAAEKLMSSARASSHHAETYRSKGFDRADAYPLSGGVTLWRDLMPDETWRTLCEEHGQNSDSSSFTLEASRASVPAGIDASPRETALIVAYLLLEGPEEGTTEQKVEALLDSLHPDPDEADRQKLLHGNLNNPEIHPGKVEELRRVARQVARLLRGAKIGGSPPARLDPDDQKIGWYVTDRLRSGEPYESVRRRLVSQGHDGSKIDRLKELGLTPPN